MSKPLTSQQLGVLKLLSQLKQRHIYVDFPFYNAYEAQGSLRQEVTHLKQVIARGIANLEEKHPWCSYSEAVIECWSMEIRKLALDFEGLKPQELMCMEQKWKELGVEITERGRRQRSYIYREQNDEYIIPLSYLRTIEQERFRQLEREQLERKQLEREQLELEREQLVNQTKQEIDEELFLLRLPIKERDIIAQRVLENERSILVPKNPVNPPAQSNAHLQAFIRGMQIKLKNAIDVMVVELKEERSQEMKLQTKLAGRLALFHRVLQQKLDQKQSTIKNLRAIIGDMLCDLRRLNQWIHEEDQMVSQEATDCLLRLLLWWLSAYLSEDVRRGGFRNLLLDGWWLEFWEIILLAAGDVERNPGPSPLTDAQLAKVDNRVLGKQDLFEVYDAVLGCRNHWFDLCLALKLPHDDLSAIKRENSGDTAACLREGLFLWLQGERATWRMLVDAVANSSGGNDLTLALEIAKKHESIQAVEASSVPSPTHRDHTEVKKSEEMSSAFNKLYRSITRQLRVNVNKVKGVLEFCSDPENLSQRCVPPSVYEDATSTKNLLRQLYPDYINPERIFILQEIVDTCGSQRCKDLVCDYARTFVQ